MQSNLKDALNEIVKKLEETATSVAAMEAALATRAVLSASDLDDQTLAAQLNVKHKLVNVRYLISKLPD